MSPANSNGRRGNWSCNLHKSVTEGEFAGRYVSKETGTSEWRNRISIVGRKYRLGPYFSADRLVPGRIHISSR